MVVANGEMKVIIDTSLMSIHLRNLGKFMGIAGSFWLSHPTIPLSRFVNGNVGMPV